MYPLNKVSCIWVAYTVVCPVCKMLLLLKTVYSLSFVSHVSVVTRCLCVQEGMSAEFLLRLKSLLQRAYSLQEEFEGVLCLSEPSSLCQGESLTLWTVHGPCSHKQLVTMVLLPQMKWCWTFCPERSWTTCVWGTAWASPPTTPLCRLLR